MYKKKNFNVILAGMISLGFIIIIALVYAAFTGQLNISGQAVNRQSKWDIHFENLSTVTTTHTAKVLTQPRLASGASIEDYSVSTTTPGDSISFTFDVVNEGNYNAEVTSVSIGTPTCTGTNSVSNSNVCAHLHYSLTYDSGASVQAGDVLYAKETNKMKVTLTYDDTVTASELATEDVSISNLGITINFQQSSDALVKDNGEVADYSVYHQGDKITLNNEDYYLIADSGAGQDYVIALKDTPLTVAEVNLYGKVGTDNNRVNRYTGSSQGTAYNSNGYGGMAYYSSETCGYFNGSYVSSGCESEVANEYKNSDIKYIVDTWVTENFTSTTSKEVDGYKARLITYDELVNDLGCTSNSCSNSSYNWVYNSNYYYWTMSPFDNPSRVWNVTYDSRIYDFADVYGRSGVVRPVINVYKSALES